MKSRNVGISRSEKLNLPSGIITLALLIVSAAGP